VKFVFTNCHLKSQRTYGIFTVCVLLCITICKSDRITVTTTKTSRFIFISQFIYCIYYTIDDGPCVTETCSSEVRLIPSKNLEVFIVETEILSLLHIGLIVVEKNFKIIYIYTKKVICMVQEDKSNRFLRYFSTCPHELQGVIIQKDAVLISTGMRN
jgi:hypothetical protein